MGAVEEVAASSLAPGETVQLQRAVLVGRMALSHKDLLVLTDQRVLVIVAEKKGARLASSWALENLPAVQFQVRSGQASTLLIGGSPMEVKGWHADGLAQSLNEAKARRLRSLESARAPPATHEVHTKEVVVREIVKVPCRYCGQLNLMNSAKCLSCGAPLG